MKVVKMKIGFWLIPSDYRKSENYHGFYWLWWHFIFKWVDSKNDDKIKDVTYNLIKKELNKNSSV